jgi:hypothetical protein
MTAALQARGEPRGGRAGSSLSTTSVQQQLMTFVNVIIDHWLPSSGLVRDLLRIRDA